VKFSEGAKVVVVEDHAMFREILTKVCAEELGLRVVAEVSDGESVIAAPVKQHDSELRSKRPVGCIVDGA